MHVFVCFDILTGRWYPGELALQDGTIVVTSGTINGDQIKYRYQGSRRVELFDYNVFKASGYNRSYIDASWQSIDVSNMPYSPYTTLLPDENHHCMEELFLDYANYFYGAVENGTITDAGCNQTKYDSFLMFPQNYLLKNGQVWVTQFGTPMYLTFQNGTARKTTFTYLMNFTKNEDSSYYDSEIGVNVNRYNISFEHGPSRRQNTTYYGTSIIDPNDDTRANFYGGMTSYRSFIVMPGQTNADFWENYGISRPGWGHKELELGTQFTGNRGTRKLEVFRIPNNDNIGELIEEDDEYLGYDWNYDRANHYSTILPTKQILISCGSTNNYYGAVKQPILLTPIYDTNYSGNFTGKYKRQFVASALQPRSYHSVALLLPDGRVINGGGNPQAILYDPSLPWTKREENFTINHGRQPPPNLDKTPLTYQVYGDYIGDPGEVWIMETYKPPYFWIDSNTSIVSLNGGINETLNNKTYHLIYSETIYSLTLANLPNEDDCSFENESSLVLIKLGSCTHSWDGGQILYDLPFWVENDSTDTITFETPNAIQEQIVRAFYMMFFVDCKGKPAHSIMVRYDDNVTTPLA